MTKLQPSIYWFRGQYFFLSNFYPVEVAYDGLRFPSAEHAYQAAKTVRAGVRENIARQPTPVAAKRLGRNVLLRPGWDKMKLRVMEDILRVKFANIQMRLALVGTGEALLEHGNTHEDYFWGVCKGYGHNHLGNILMKLRDEYVYQKEQK